MRKKGRSIKKRLYALLLICLLPLTAVAATLLVQIYSFSSRYDSIVEKISEINDYNIDFKEDMDYAVYIYVVNSDRASEIVGDKDPITMIQEARAVFTELYDSESGEYGRVYLSRILTCLDSLEEHVLEIQEDALEAGNYDSNMEKLELDIYVLTDLIQEQIQKYIYYETGVLSSLSGDIRKDMYSAMLMSIGLTILIIVIAVMASWQLMKEITEPIQELCEDMRRAGQGDFDVSANEISDDEMVTLNQGFNQMVQQISQLVEDIKEEQANLRVMEIGLLQAQINPHFLYNTLSTITWLAEAGENKKVVMMVDYLSNFFRLSLSRGEEFIRVEEEVSLTRSYLQIQKVRYEDILNFEIDIPDEMKDYILPKLTLQPLVENSIYHGLKNKRGGGTVRISGHLEPEHLEFTVSDDGRGMDEETLAQLRKAIEEVQKTEGEGSGFGVYNVNQRIKLYYGEEYGLSVDSTFGEGTMARIILPRVDK